MRNLSFPIPIAVKEVDWDQIRRGSIKAPWINQHDRRILVVCTRMTMDSIMRWVIFDFQWFEVGSWRVLTTFSFGSISCLVPDKDGTPFGIVHCFCKEWPDFSLWYLSLPEGITHSLYSSATALPQVGNVSLLSWQHGLCPAVELLGFSMNHLCLPQLSILCRGIWQVFRLQCLKWSWNGVHWNMWRWLQGSGLSSLVCWRVAFFF